MGLGVALFGGYLWERNGTERDRLVSVTLPIVGGAGLGWAAWYRCSNLLDMEPGGGSYLPYFALGG